MCILDAEAFLWCDFFFDLASAPLPTKIKVATKSQAVRTLNIVFMDVHLPSITGYSANFKSNFKFYVAHDLAEKKHRLVMRSISYDGGTIECTPVH